MLNDVTMNLPAYPMEELAKIRTKLKEDSVKVYDFGTGDPQIPTWPPIRDAMKAAIPEISQYPTIRGTKELQAAIWNYCDRRFGFEQKESLDIIPTRKQGSGFSYRSEPCRTGRQGPILYQPWLSSLCSSTRFAGGVPT